MLDSCGAPRVPFTAGVLTQPAQVPRLVTQPAQVACFACFASDFEFLNVPPVGDQASCSLEVLAEDPVSTGFHPEVMS